MKIKEFEKICKFKVLNDFEFKNMGMVSSTVPGTVSFAVDKRILEKAISNNNITAIITTGELSDRIKNKEILISEDPKDTFFKLYNEWTKTEKEDRASVISEKAVIHSTASIAKSNVVIEDGVIIEENVVIRAGSRVGENSIIRANTVIGNEGIEVKKIDGTDIMIKHNGYVDIGSDVWIQSNCCIDTGIYGETTTIGNHTKIDTLCRIGHNVKIGDNCIIITLSTIAGSTTVGNNVWIGPGCIISNGLDIGDNANIAIGSVILKDVPADSKVIALPQRMFPLK